MDVFLAILMLVAVAMLVAPVLAIAAYIRVRRLEGAFGKAASPESVPRAGSGEDLGPRIARLEAGVRELETRIEAIAAAGSTPPVTNGRQARAGEQPPPAVSEPAAEAPVADEPGRTAAREGKPAMAASATTSGAGRRGPPAEPAAHAARSGAGPAPPGRLGKGGIDLEALIGGRWLNRVGIVLLLFAAAFFLRLAFDNNWIGPTGRVAIGLLTGAMLMAYSQWLGPRGYRYFAEGLVGLGAGVLYLSLYAGWGMYELFPQAVAFGGMVVVTAALCGLAVARDSQRLALLALTGGFTTPALLRTGTDQQMVLFSYLAALDAALIGLAWARTWRGLELIALAFTQLYFWGWYSSWYEPEKLAPTLFFATLLFLLFAAVPVVRARAGQAAGIVDAVVVLGNSLLYALALHLTLFEDHRWALTLAVLALAVVHLAIVRALPRPAEDARVARVLYAGLALTFVTLVVPIRLEGQWIAIAWAVEGAVLVYGGLRIGSFQLRVAGLVLFALALWGLVAFPIDAERFLLNARFATMAVTAACYGAAALLALHRREALRPDEARVFIGLGMLANGVALVALSLEVYEGVGRLEGLADTELAQKLALSLLWTGYATVLMVAGVRGERASLRWQALALFGLAVGKVLLYDLAELERVYRIVSFVVLGIVLLVVSFLYQRRLALGGSGEP